MFAYSDSKGRFAYIDPVFLFGGQVCVHQTAQFDAKYVKVSKNKKTSP